MNVAKGKSNSDSERWQNSHLTADKVIIHSEAGGLTLDAANLKAKRLEAEVQHLNITSRQDREKYESKQVSAGASGSVAYGSGGGASVNAAYSKVKVDYAQVNEQAGISVGEEGMNVKVHQHTQLNGGVIESEAEISKNHLQTHSISSTDIENHSEIKTESASISAGSGGINPMQALSSALSLLGNRHESSRSHTKSAISQNIAIQTKAPENLTALSRDTKNANEQVQKQDLQKVQESQEMAKVLGNIADNSIAIATYAQREEIARLKREKAKVENQQGKESPQAQALNTQIQQLEKNLDTEFGLGSAKGMAIRAVTAALQSAVQNDSAGALTALASPYLNQAIHQATEGNQEANLMAHALLSAVEFAATGKDPITGAIAGVTGEATAQYLTKALYNKTPNELTASEKENISTLSQLAGGLAGAFTAKTTGNTPQQGGSFLSAVAGAETAKRAVENNYLSEEQQKTFEKELIECKSQKRDCSDVIKKYLDISNKSSRALYKNCKDGGVRCAGKEEIIDVSTNISRAKYDTSGRIFIGTALQDDDAIRIINYLNERDLSYLKEKVSNTDRLIYQSLDISNWPAILFGMRNLLTNNSKVAFSSGAISMGANAAIQYSFNKDIDINDVITAGLLGKATAGRSYINTINSNMISSYYISRIKGENDAAYSALSSYFSSMAGYRIGGRVENKINPFFNPAKDKYKWIESNHLGVSFQPKPSTIPSTTGNVFNSLSSELFNNKLTEGKE